jgi:hypothetical protein
MDIGPDLRLALLELTHVLDRLRTADGMRSKVAEDLAEGIHFRNVVDLTLAQARRVLDFGESAPPDFEHKPPMWVPPWDVGRRIHARRARAVPVNAPSPSRPRV